MSEQNQQFNSAPDYRERQLQKKASREAEVMRARRKKTVAKIGWWVAIAIIVIGSGWLLFNASRPKGPDYSRAYPILGRNHIPDGSVGSYNSNPPTSGDHYARPAQTGFYGTELPDETLVHNLEHGNVWIAYKPGLPDDVIKSLRKLSGGNVVVTLRGKNNTDVAVVAWGRLDAFNLDHGGLDLQRIKDFMSRYQNQGPENPTGIR